MSNVQDALKRFHDETVEFKKTKKAEKHMVKYHVTLEGETAIKFRFLVAMCAKTKEGMLMQHIFDEGIQEVCRFVLIKIAKGMMEQEMEDEKDE